MISLFTEDKKIIQIIISSSFNKSIRLLTIFDKDDVQSRFEIIVNIVFKVFICRQVSCELCKLVINFNHLKRFHMNGKYSSQTYATAYNSKNDKIIIS